MNVKTILGFLRRFVRAREAVSALEYAILVGVVVAAVGAALVTFSGNIETALTKIGTSVASVNAPTMPNLTGSGSGTGTGTGTGTTGTSTGTTGTGTG